MLSHRRRDKFSKIAGMNARTVLSWVDFWTVTLMWKNGQNEAEHSTWMQLPTGKTGHRWWSELSVAPSRQKTKQSEVAGEYVYRKRHCSSSMRRYIGLIKCNASTFALLSILVCGVRYSHSVDGGRSACSAPVHNASWRRGWPGTSSSTGRRCLPGGGRTGPGRRGSDGATARLRRGGVRHSPAEDGGESVGGLAAAVRRGDGRAAGTPRQHVGRSDARQGQL